MSRFVCGMRRFDKHKTTVPDKPSQNSETDKRLQEMIALRNQQDNGIFQPLPVLPTPVLPTSAQVMHTILQQMDR